MRLGVEKREDWKLSPFLGLKESKSERCDCGGGRSWFFEAGEGLAFTLSPVLSFCGLWLGGSLVGWLLAFQNY